MINEVLIFYFEMGVDMVDGINANKTQWMNAISSKPSARIQKPQTASSTMRSDVNIEKMRQIQEKIESGQYVVNLDQLAERLTTAILIESDPFSNIHHP